MQHQFQPTRYYNTFGTYEPVLRIASGDTVSTRTIDARGFDAQGQQVAERGNPLTGPFYIEEAEPGDTLQVTIEHVWPDRDEGWTRTVVAPSVLEPAYVREMPEGDMARWQVDRTAGTATLLEPETRLGRFTLPLDPMLGCLGVAPYRQQAISSATSGEHGGNMDYRGLKAGVTVYFPVFVPGALFFVGDGHAVQGDGEIIGTGIEISMEVRFSVHLLKGVTITWPRGENAEYLFAIGNARPLDQAVQHATSELLRWLRQDYGLDPFGASLLLGQCVEYDLGNIFDPAYTMVCKIAKKLLPAS